MTPPHRGEALLTEPARGFLQPRAEGLSGGMGEAVGLRGVQLSGRGAWGPRGVMPTPSALSSARADDSVL